MKTNISGLILEEGKVIGPIAATTRHMTIQIEGREGTITGAKSVDGINFTDVDTYEFTGPIETFDIDVNAAGTIIQLTTTGVFGDAWLITEG